MCMGHRKEFFLSRIYFGVFGLVLVMGNRGKNEQMGLDLMRGRRKWSSLIFFFFESLQLIVRE